MRKRLSITVEEKTIDQLYEAAKEENRSVSNLVEKIAKEHLKKRERR